MPGVYGGVSREGIGGDLTDAHDRESIPRYRLRGRRRMTGEVQAALDLVRRKLVLGRGLQFVRLVGYGGNGVVSLFQMNGNHVIAKCALEPGEEYDEVVRDERLMTEVIISLFDRIVACKFIIIRTPLLTRTPSVLETCRRYACGVHGTYAPSYAAGLASTGKERRWNLAASILPARVP